MKHFNYSIKMDRAMDRAIFFCVVLLFAITCARRMGAQDAPLHTVGDISNYATITADRKSKESTIEVLESGAWKLYEADNSGNIRFNTPLAEASTRGRWHLGNCYHVYCLVWGDGSRVVLGMRQLPIEGQPNFRDLGGYRTMDGRHVKRGLVFRSGKCNTITGADQRYLAEIPLKTVVDFRSEQERAAEPDRVPRSVVLQQALPIDPGSLGASDVSNAIAQGDTARARQYLIDGNKKFVTDYQGEYKAFFSLLMNKDNTPLMFHCTAGKDRTGFGAALFLASLGVDRETIIQDYLLTNALSKVSIESMRAQYGNNNVAFCMYYLLSAQRAYIETAFATIETKYGGVDNFLTTQLNVDLDKMRELYLY